MSTISSASIESRPPRSDLQIVKAPTGIDGFDEISGGGLPASRTTLLLGGPGAGKTVFALETLVNAAGQYREPGIFVAFEENSRAIMANAATFGWDLPALERERLFFLDAHLSPAFIQAGDFDITAILAALTAKIEEMGAKRIVFDGLDVLLTVLDDPAKERREVYRLHEWLQNTGVTAILTAKSAEADRPSAERYAFMQFMVDAVVLFSHRVMDRVSLRGVRIMKYRGSGFSENEFPMIISPTGVEVSMFGSSELLYDVSTERISSGIPRLDTMLDGGYYRGSAVLISGAPGTAKTTLAGAFAQAACLRGEKVLWVSFDEASSQIVRNLASVDIELCDHVKSGTLRIESQRTESRSAEEHLMVLKRIMSEFEPRHIILDPVSALAKTGGHVAAVHASLRLLDVARAAGMTVVSTSLVAAESGFTEQTSAHISTIADTWLHLAYVIQGGERNRTLTVVKSRGMPHSNQVRELILANEGITLADVFSAGGEVLVGTARWEYERTMREENLRQEAVRFSRRQQLAHAEDEINSRIASLESELARRRLEIDSLDHEDEERTERRQVDRSELLRRRHADSDTDRVRV